MSCVGGGELVELAAGPFAGRSRPIKSTKIETHLALE